MIKALPSRVWVGFTVRISRTRLRLRRMSFQPVANKPDRYEWLVTVAYDAAAKYHIEGEPDATIVEGRKDDSSHDEVHHGVQSGGHVAHALNNDS